MNGDGLLVKGFRADDSGKITTQLDSIKLDRQVIDAKKTESVDISMNLDIRSDALAVGFDPTKP
ncbi:hypothetical protein C1882_28950, partial [Pseudomonas sp. FW305-E2]